ncbi:hypothetical protein AYM40_29435 [Paraburkholderia phytofirmans OLGA172]|uniref:Uncharacterized protein n=1 Tax=Paraburkholderia phytofirmans OLGA172 TaxID=1417228 RepID=A0A160FT73_9BURK|nr:hypothetical protein [Paraburkholderia phytofirmans]ANB76365.1 hypothetical protein AYM40_29435 [Paraburkholderia phytofirmans OLGA172]
MRHFIVAAAIAAHPFGVRKTAVAGALVALTGHTHAGLMGEQRTVAVAIDLAYAQVKNDFLVLAGCVKADIPTNTAEDLHDDSKTNDHPATPVDRGR